MPSGFLVWFLVGFIAQLGALVFLSLTWTTRGVAIFPMMFLKSGYFILNPVLRPGGLTSAGRRYRLLAFLCWGVMLLAFIALSRSPPSLT